MFLSESWRERRKQHLNTLCKSLQRDLYEHRIAPCLPLPHKAAVSEPGTWDPCPPWPPAFQKSHLEDIKKQLLSCSKDLPPGKIYQSKYIFFIHIYMCSGIYMCTPPLSGCMYTNIQFNFRFLMWMHLFRYKWLSAVWVEFGGRVPDILFKKHICKDRPPKWNYT